MPSADSRSPFDRADACVMCPTSFVPFGRMVRSSVDFTASVVCAVTASPALAFLESIDEVSSALIGVPPASDASLCPLSPLAAGTCAEAKRAMKQAPNIALTDSKVEQIAFIMEGPPETKYHWRPGNWAGLLVWI